LNKKEITISYLFSFMSIYLFFPRRHFSEQYTTLSQSFAHFLRQANGFWQMGQIFCGKLTFLCAILLILMTAGFNNRRLYF